MNRNRAFSAIINDGKIAMIYNVRPGRNFWTLPGGGIEKNENLEEAAIREAKEEANLRIKIIRYLYKKEYSEGTQYCFLAETLHPEEIKHGTDPEVNIEEQSITKAEWIKISDVKDDSQVTLVLKELTNEEISKYKIY